jgi:hypothetical protein
VRRVRQVWHAAVVTSGKRRPGAVTIVLLIVTATLALALTLDFHLGLPGTVVTFALGLPGLYLG